MSKRNPEVREKTTFKNPIYFQRMKRCTCATTWWRLRRAAERKANDGNFASTSATSMKWFVIVFVGNGLYLLDMFCLCWKCLVFVGNVLSLLEMVCICWKCFVFVGNGLYLLEMFCLCWKCFVFFIQNGCLFKYGFAFVGNGLSLFKMVVFLNTVLPVSIFLYTASAYNNENPPYPVVPLAAAWIGR